MSARRNTPALPIVVVIATLVLLTRVDVGVAASRKQLRTSSIPPLQASAVHGTAVSATPLAPSPAAGSLIPGTNDDDVFAVTLAAGDRLHVAVTGDAQSDVDIYLLWPGTSELAGPYAATAVSTGPLETLEFDAPVSGLYYLDLYCAGDATTYTLVHSKTRAVNSGELRRVSDRDRYSTALAISRDTFPANSSDDVVLAGGARYPDALSAAALAGSLGCPLLLTNGTALSPGVASEISRLGAENVHIVGGPMSVSDAVVKQLTSRGMVVERFGGRDRFEVAYRVAVAVNELNPSIGARVFLASGEVFPDALSASPYSYRKGYPILLTRAGALHADTSRALAKLKTETVFISGGPRSVSPGVEAELKRRGMKVVRLYGQDRYETASAVAGYAVANHWGDPSYMAIASGQVFPDALVGGAAVGSRGGVMVLTPQSRLGSEASSFSGEWSSLGLVDKARVYGGPMSISTSAEASFRKRVAP